MSRERKYLQKNGILSQTHTIHQGQRYEAVTFDSCQNCKGFVGAGEDASILLSRTVTWSKNFLPAFLPGINFVTLTQMCIGRTPAFSQAAFLKMFALIQIKKHRFRLSFNAVFLLRQKIVTLIYFHPLVK